VTPLRAGVMVRWWHLGLIAALTATAFVAWRVMLPTPVTTGAVLATVDGVPVTDFDLQAEAQGKPVDKMDDAEEKALLAQVIDRRLLVGVAHKQGIDSSPLFRATVARAGEMVAAGAASRELADPPEPAGDAEAKRYMAANPLLFGQRQLLVVDGVIATMSDGQRTRIDAADTLEQLIVLLEASKIPFERVERRIDTAALPKDMATKLLQRKAGDLFALPAGGKLLIGTVTARQPQILPEPEQLALARNAAGQERQQTQLRDALASLRKKAKIQYLSPSSAP
jgi:EpsD family peptidyl-prolyl cis-trans isomerase